MVYGGTCAVSIWFFSKKKEILPYETKSRFLYVMYVLDHLSLKKL